MCQNHVVPHDQSQESVVPLGKYTYENVAQQSVKTTSEGQTPGTVKRGGGVLSSRAYRP